MPGDEGWPKEIVTDCPECGLEIFGTRHKTNPTKWLWSHPDLKACKKVKPI